MLPAVPTRKPSSHNTYAAIWRLNDNREVELLVVTVRQRDSKGHVIGLPEIKLPGGGSSRPDEPPIVTLGREVLEETYLFIDPECVQQSWSLPADVNHTRLGFIIPFESCRGVMRRTTIFEEDGAEMSEPRFMKAWQLRDKLILSQRNFLLSVLLNVH